MKLVYLDLDGVLFDLHAALVRFTGIPMPMEDRNALFKTYLPFFVDAGGFATIPVLEKAYELVHGVLSAPCHVAILTSGGSFHDSRGEIARQKKVCLDAAFPDLSQVPFCFTSSGASKSIMANKKSFLIDDHSPNIEKFVGAGGRGIIYRPSEVGSVLNEVWSFCHA